MTPNEKDNVEAQSLQDSIDRVIHAPARLSIMTYLYVVDNADYIFLMRQTGLTWGNLASHLGKLEDAGYIEIEKQFVDKKPHSTVSLSVEGRTAFENYREQMRGILDL